MRDYDIEIFSKNYKPRDNRNVRYSVDRQRSRRYKKTKNHFIRKATVVIAMTYGLVNFVPHMFAPIVNEKNSVEATTSYVEYMEPATVKIETETIATEETKPKKEKKKVETKPFEYMKVFDIGGNGDDEVKQFLGEESAPEYNADGSINPGFYIYKYSEDYGVDPNLIAAICYQETGCDHYSHCPGGELYSGFGVGITQLESPPYNYDEAEKVTAYNYTTGENDTLAITMDNACSLATNIQIGCMLFQNNIEYYNGNISLAVQSHNYGQGMVDLVLYNYYTNEQHLREDYPSVVNDIKSQYPNEYSQILSSLGEHWDTIKTLICLETKDVPTNAILDAHNNPLNYIKTWSYGTYGDGEYIDHVFSHCPTKIVKYRTNGYKYTTNIETMNLLEKEFVEKHVK